MRRGELGKNSLVPIFTKFISTAASSPTITGGSSQATLHIQRLSSWFAGLPIVSVNFEANGIFARGTLVLHRAARVGSERHRTNLLVRPGGACVDAPGADATAGGRYTIPMNRARGARLRSLPQRTAASPKRSSNEFLLRDRLWQEIGLDNRSLKCRMVTHTTRPRPHC